MLIKLLRAGFIGFVIVALFAGLTVLESVPKKDQHEKKLEYERGLADGREIAEREIEEKLNNELKKYNGIPDIILWALHRNLDGVMEIRDGKIKTFLNGKPAIAGGKSRPKEVKNGQYDYFVFVNCPEDGSAIAIANKGDGQFFQVHFTGEIPDRKEGMNIDRGSVSFY